MRTTADIRYCGIFVSVKPRYARIMVGRDGEASACWFHSCQSANPVTSCHPFSSGAQVVKPTNEAVTMVNANPCARQEFIWRFYSCKNTTITSLSQQQKAKHALNCLMAPAFLLPVFQLTRAIHLVTGASPSLPTFRGL